MGRESRHLWIGNVPDNATENDIIDYFTPFGEVDKLEFLTTKDSPVGVTAVVSFLSLQIAAKIHKMTHKIANNAVTTRYHDFSSSAASDSKADVKDKRPRNDEFQRKRSASPARGRDIKRKIDIAPAGGPGRNQGSATDNFEYRKRVIICHNLPGNHSVHALSTGLYHEFKQIGKIKQLWMNTERGVKTAVIMYHDSQVAHMAYDELNRKTLFGKTLDLELVKDKDAYTSYPDTSSTELRRNDPVEERREPVAPRRFEQREISRRHSDDLVTDEGASSTLFVGNLSGNVRYKDLMSLFKRYGDIECIDIKESDKGYPYAFIRYYDLKSACAAKKYLNEEILHERSMKIGYGKGCQTNTVMAMEIDRQCLESKVEHEFGKFGELVRMTYNQTLGSALCTYTDTESAQLAIENMRGRCLGRTGRVKVDFANHEECQEFYKNYEQCKASQQLMKYHMDMIAQSTERETRTKKYDDFRGDERRSSYDRDRKYPVSPDRRGSQYSNKRYERVERTASRNVRDITPSPPPMRSRDPGPVDRRQRRSYDNDWKGKGKALSRKHSDEGRMDRDRAGSGRAHDGKMSRVVSSRYNSEERELARNIRDSRNSSRERPSERVDFHHSNMKRLSKKPSQRSPSPSSPSNKYSKYKDSDRSKDFYKQRSSGGRPASSMMDNDWDSKKFKDGKRESRGSSRAETRRESRGGSRGGSPREESRDDGRDKRKKDRRSTLSEEEEEILNSLIAMRRVEKSRQKKSQRRADRDGSETREPSKRDRSDRDKRKRKRKHSKDSTDDSSDESSSSSSGTSDGEIDVGNHGNHSSNHSNHGNGEQKQPEQAQLPPQDTALDRIAKIISDSTNGQVQLNTAGTTQPLPSERYSPSENEIAPAPPTMIQTMIPIPPAAVQPLLPLLPYR
ncbi:hypothetical protein ACHWQZ_G006647 [Mnemiopsis leidyi]